MIEPNAIGRNCHARETISVVVALQPQRFTRPAKRLRPWPAAASEKSRYGQKKPADLDPDALLACAAERQVTLPAYMAELVVCGDQQSAGLRHSRRFVEQVFHSLRPFGGTALVTCSEIRHDALLQVARDAALDHGELKRSGSFSVLTRAAAPEGSANWTHQYGSSANPAVSTDSVVRAPLGLSWFGGPSNESVLPRLGHGPTPHVVNGRLFTKGVALDGHLRVGLDSSGSRSALLNGIHVIRNVAAGD